MKRKKNDEIRQFAKDRNEAMFSLDEGKIRDYCKKYDIAVPANERVFWGGIYKAICNTAGAPPEIVKTARQRLKEMGWSENIK